MLDIKDRSVTELNIFNGAYNMDPAFSNDGSSVFFLSDADGFRNMYRYDIESQRVFRLTQYMTGISGITTYSPAISTAFKSDLIVYNYYFNNRYRIIAANQSEFRETEADPKNVNLEAGTLPPYDHVSVNIVDRNLYDKRIVVNLPADSVRNVPYRSKFKLDYISNSANIGLSTGMYRNNMSGSVNMLFSDMVGNNQMFATLALNGKFMISEDSSIC
jgi:hypothetical protein